MFVDVLLCTILVNYLYQKSVNSVIFLKNNIFKGSIYRFCITNNGNGYYDNNRNFNKNLIITFVILCLITNIFMIYFNRVLLYLTQYMINVFI